MGVQINGDTGNISATKADYSGNVTIGGTLTYEDVTNIDSVGLITAREGIEVGARPGVAASISVDGDAIFSGITTIGGNVKVGTGITLSPDGDAFHTGVVTAPSFSGDGSALTGLSGVSVANQSDNRVITNTGTTDALNAEANLVFTGTRLGINQTSPAPLSGGGAGLIHIAASDNPEVVLERTASGTEAKASIRVTDSEDFKIAVKDGSASTVNAVSIATSTGFMTNNNPIFNVRPAEGYQVLSNQTNTKIVFAENIDGFTERGGGFDFTNNRFVVPLDGYYHFSYIVYYYIVSEARVAIYKNGSRIHINMGVVLNSEVNPHQVSGSYSLLLSKGDYIELYGYCKGSSTTRIWSSGATWNETSFMGHLIG